MGFIGHNGAAAVVPVLEDGRLLMVTQYRNALDRFTLEICEVLTPENLQQMRQRGKRKEETGYSCGSIEPLITIGTTVAFCNEKIDIYLARNLQKGQQHLDEDEFCKCESIGAGRTETMIYDGTIQDSKTIAAIWHIRTNM